MVNLVASGIGTREFSSLTAINEIKNSDILIGAKRLLLPFTELPIIQIHEYKAEKIFEHILQNQSKRICVIYSGDTGFYSGCTKLIPLLNNSNIDYKITPGLSSVQYFSAKIKKPWESWKLLSAHGKTVNIIRECMDGQDVFFLCGGEIKPNVIAKTLYDAGINDCKMYVGENLSYCNEKIVIDTAENISRMDFEQLSVVLVEKLPTCDGRKIGINDSDFIRSDVPMTKRFVRSAIISIMNPQRDDIIWDIGAGTGSVSVELALHCGELYAIEKSMNAERIIMQNKMKYYTYNMHVINGYAPDCFEGLPIPDKVFIGGSDGMADEIISYISSVNAAVQLAATAITLESLHELTTAMKKYGFETEVHQISVSSSKELGRYTMMEAQNSVYLIGGTK